VAIFVTLGATILAVWEVNIGGLLVGAGFLGIVVGFAARQTLGSLIAGFVLMFSRPFTIGDWVEIGDNQGVVTDITIFNTRLENFDGEFIVIPNDQVSDRSVTNRSRKGLLRLRTDVGVDYEADVEDGQSGRPRRDGGRRRRGDVAPAQVVPKGFGDSAILLELRYWIDHPSPPGNGAPSRRRHRREAPSTTQGSLSRTPSGLSPGAEASLDADGQRSNIDGDAASGRSVSPHRATRTTETRQPGNDESGAE